jgi:TP901 family phage tail tape measure protein
VLNNLGLGFAITAKNLASAVFKETQDDLGKTEEKSKETGKAFEELGEKMKTGGAVVAAAGGALLATLALGAVKAHEIGEALKLVATRADESVLPIEKVKESVLALSNQYGTSQTEEARAFYDAIGLGATTAASSQALVTAATRLAVGTQTDLKSAMDTTAQAARAFGVPLERAGEVADQLFAASSRGAGSIGELGEGLIHLGPAAASAGLTTRDLLGTMTALAEHGVRGRAAMAGMKGVLEAIAAPTAEAKAEAAALGLTLDKGKIAAMGFGPWLETLAANSHLTADAMKKLGLGGEAAIAAMALLKNKGGDTIEAINQIGDSSGAAADAAEHMTDEFKRFGALKDNALAALGEGILKLLEPLVRMMNNALEWFTGLDEGTQSLITSGIAFTGVTLVLTGVLMAAYGAFLLFDTAAGAAALAMAILGIEIFAIVGGALAVLALAWYGVKKAWDADLGGIKTTVTELWTKLKLAWDAITQLFSQGGFSGAVREELDKAGNGGIKGFAISVFLWFNRIKAAWEGFSGAIGEAFDAAAPIFHELGEIFSELAGAFGSLFSGPNNPKANADAFHAFAEAGKLVGSSVAGLLKLVLLLVQVGLVPLRLIVAALTGGWDGFKEAALSSFSGVIAGMLGLAASAAGIADHLAGIFGKDLGAKKAVEEFTKGLGLDGKAGTVTKNAGGGQVVGSFVNTPTTTIGPNSPAVVAAAAARGRLESGLKDPTADQDKRLLQAMQPVLQALRENGNRPIIVHMDGEKVAELTAAGARRSGDRGFGALPSPG